MAAYEVYQMWGVRSTKTYQSVAKELNESAATVLASQLNNAFEAGKEQGAKECANVDTK